MKHLLLFIIVIAFVLMGCVTTQPKVEIKVAAQQEEKLTKNDVAMILMLAINDIEKQGCTAEFLSERGGYIWCRCKDKTVRYYDLDKLVEKYKESKQKAREAQDVEKTGGN